MYSLKERITARLSSLLGDSPSTPRESPDVTSESKGRSPSVSFILPSTNKDGHNSDKREEESKPAESLPLRCNIQSLSFKLAGNSPACEEREATSPLEVYETPFSARIVNTAEVFEDANEQPSPLELMPNLTEESSFISLELYEFLSSSLPNIVKGCQWSLLYRAVP